MGESTVLIDGECVKVQGQNKFMLGFIKILL